MRGFHHCGMCARWAELLEAFREGRVEEAVLEARRLLAGDLKRPKQCLIGVRCRGLMRQSGWVLG